MQSLMCLLTWNGLLGYDVIANTESTCFSVNLPPRLHSRQCVLSSYHYCTAIMSPVTAVTHRPSYILIILFSLSLLYIQNFFYLVPVYIDHFLLHIGLRVLVVMY